ncbi:MAG TPA: 5-(carboxyamino)imidazole ribonucleotide mutase [Trueperaceae bacterium]|nr:5-(carboxyamino)imidazole ribonucleotide mutase [Trueperaceae bacterium]
MARLLSADPEGIASAAEHLGSGGLVAFPTETVYGLGASATDVDAVRRVFAAKGRPADHPLIVHLPDASWLWRWADREALQRDVVDVVEDLVAAFWPGPLTLVLPARDDVPRVVTGGQDTVAVRVPADPVAARLLGAFGGALVAPSANRFGAVSPTLPRHVMTEFADRSDILVLEGGRTRHGLESTIVDLSTGEATLLRPGALPLEALEARVRIGPAAKGSPRAPGTLSRHYAPRTPLRVVKGEELMGLFGDRTGVIGRRMPEKDVDHAPFAGDGPVTDGSRWLVLADDPAGFARDLYAAVRHLDALGLEEILVEEAGEGDEWLAVRDRLSRATGRDAARPLVAVVMGSASDWETMRHADEVLNRFEVPHVCRVVSAHRTPHRLASFALGAADAGIEVIVAGAGGAAHLPGMIAAHTHLPVLGVPVRSSALSGMDSLLSVVQMPRGVPVGTLAIGEAGAVNAALLAVSILALDRVDLRERLLRYREEQTEQAAAATLPTESFEP